MTIGGQSGDMVCRTSGGHWWAGALSTCCLGFLVIIYRDLTRLHMWTVWRWRWTVKSTKRDGRKHKNKRGMTPQIYHICTIKKERHIHVSQMLVSYMQGTRCLKGGKIQLLKLIMAFLTDITPYHHHHQDSLWLRPCYPIHCLPSCTRVLIKKKCS